MILAVLVRKDGRVNTTTLGPGHVFVIKGDMRHLACDAYLQSTDRDLRHGGSWLRAIPDAESRLVPSEREAFQAERTFAMPVRVASANSREPTPVLVAVPYYGTTEANQLRDRIAAYFAVAASMVRERGQSSFGERPLIALPLFAHRAGGGGPVVGDILRVLLDEARKAVGAYGFDVAIVLRDARAYDLAQVIRREDDSSWTELTAEQRRIALELGDEAARARLVPFMGSGISVTAGAPTWHDLILRLAEEAGLNDEDARSLAAAHRDVLDQAAYLHREFARRHADDRHAFANAVIRSVSRERYGLAPALLASLRAEQSITLNYDDLFERAAADSGLARRVIPGGEHDGERWLLKLHGTISDPDSIVLTRADYLGYDTDRGALSSLVKATLMTRRLLFVGFGMSDSHFHEIVHDVRRALPSSTHDFGTVLTLRDDPVTQRLWERDLEFVTFESARLLDVFLDAVMAFAADSHSYLLARGYASTLGPADARIADRVRALVNSLDDTATQSPAWPILRQALQELGWDPD